jgi:hypothetical protein
MSLLGRWRILEMELWDKDFLDLLEPAYILFGAPVEGDGAGFARWEGAGDAAEGELAFGVGADEMDEAHGEGWAELQDDGSLLGEISFHNGDESGFIARRCETSSTAC